LEFRDNHYRQGGQIAPALGSELRPPNLVNAGRMIEEEVLLEKALKRAFSSLKNCEKVI